MKRSLALCAILLLVTACSSDSSPETPGDTRSGADRQATDDAGSGPEDQLSAPDQEAAPDVLGDAELAPDVADTTGPWCGDGQCNGDEDGESCPADCAAESVCGDTICAGDEDHESCPEDCPDLPVCGDGTCEGDETAQSCPADCKAEPDKCGDGECADGETWQTCPEDCENACGNGTCEPEEDCQLCPADCGPCPGETFCKLSGSAGQEVLCPVQVARAGEASAPAVGLQFKFNFDSEAAVFDRFHDTMCFDENNCMDWDTPPQGSIQPSGHTLAYQELGDGIIKLVLYHGSQPTLSLTNAWFDGEELVGDPALLDIVFVLNQDIDEQSPLEVTLDDLKATDATATPLEVSLGKDLLITE